MAGRCAFSGTERNSGAGGFKPAQHLLRRLLLLLVALYGGLLHAATYSPVRSPTIVDVDLNAGTVAVSGPDRDRASTPGSTLKPIVLLTALQLGVIAPSTRVACNGGLHVAGRNLACAHPAALGILDAEEALAYSCNSYFARVAQQLPTAALQASMQRFGIHPLATVTTPDARVLLVLGLRGISVTPPQLARSYVQLARALQQGDSQAVAVRSGLLGSVSYGMAHAAQTTGFMLGGKTGTAHDANPMMQHGWFAGIIFAAEKSPRATRVVVVYAPGGNGSDAAMTAHRYLQGKP